MELGHEANSKANNIKLTANIDWSDISNHKEFQANSSYQAFLERVGAMFAAPPKLHHVHFRTPFSAVAAAPVVEMLTIYLSEPVDDTSFENTMVAFLGTLAENALGYFANAHGWVVEELEHEAVEEKAKGYFAAIGWESYEAHMQYRETQAFKGSIPSLRNVAKGTTMVSAAISYSPPSRGFRLSLIRESIMRHSIRI